MKRKLFVAFMVVFTVLLAIELFIALICGAPIDGNDVGRYIFSAAGISILLPASFSFFFITTIDLSKKLENIEKATKDNESSEIPDNIPIAALVNALAEERNLSPEGKKKLKKYLEDL